MPRRALLQCTGAPRCGLRYMGWMLGSPGTVSQQVALRSRARDRTLDRGFIAGCVLRAPCRADRAGQEVAIRRCPGGRRPGAHQMRARAHLELFA